ncbi:MAG: DNA replication/repair protein RecF [Woeseiaceae bacterium]
MGLASLKCTDFRCIESADLDFAAGNNLVFGPNGSGKTSVLEAIAYLGRGRSFRGASTRQLIRHGQDEFVLFGRVENDGWDTRIGVRNSAAGLEVHTNGEKRASTAVLAEGLPLQVIDPDVHKLVAGGPEDRRRYVDWIAFHVEHSYLDLWRRYRRTLKQRNAALRAGATARALTGWDKEIVDLGSAVDEVRRNMLDITRPAFLSTGEALLGTAIDFEYYRGWSAGHGLAEALLAAVQRDQQAGASQVGPHRADIRLKLDDRQARKLVSRGQQKLLACAMILAATEVVQTCLERPLLLLLDDPAAELDQGSLRRLMDAVRRLGSQVIATTLEADKKLFVDKPRLFHVEHGAVEIVQ